MRYSEPAVQSDDLSPFDQMLALGGVILGRQILALFALACRAVVALVDEPREPRSRPAR